MTSYEVTGGHFIVGICNKHSPMLVCFHIIALIHQQYRPITLHNMKTVVLCLCLLWLYWHLYSLFKDGCSPKSEVTSKVFSEEFQFLKVSLSDQYLINAKRKAKALWGLLTKNDLLNHFTKDFIYNGGLDNLHPDSVKLTDARTMKLSFLNATWPLCAFILPKRCRNSPKSDEISIPLENAIVT